MKSERFLRQRDYTFIVVRDQGSWQPRHNWYGAWQQAESKALALAHVCAGYERDGITVYLASQPWQKRVCTEVEMLAATFQLKHPPQASYLLPALEDAIQGYLSRRHLFRDSNGEMIIVLVDQVPMAQRDGITHLLVETTKKLKQNATGALYELGISFVQVGRDPDTKAFLEFLDNDLIARGAFSDIVDAKSWFQISHETVTQFLLDGLSG